MPSPNKADKGFTLAELLIALVILGEIATFTIPKILQTQQNQQKVATAKEALASISGAFMQYKYSVGITAGSSMDYDLFQYMNYVKWDTTSTIDGYPLLPGVYTCSNATPCIRLHNGGLLRSSGASWYDATSTTSAISFLFDPDGAYTGANDSISFNVYTDGALRTRENIRSNTTYPGPTVRGPQGGADPTWFSW